MVVGLKEVLSTIDPLNGQHHGGVVGQLVKEPSVSLKNVLMAIKPLIVRDTTRKIIAFIVEVQLDIHVLHELGFKTDGSKVVDIRDVVFEFNLLAAISQPPFIVVTEH